MLDVIPETYRLERDPDDSLYINLAIAADAQLIVSRDHDLLSLMDLASETGSDFHKRFPTIRILTPPAFLAEITA